ncbi:serine/threonine-protein kinase [Nannocystis radixulma]|uniref:Serine/threonine-protein kinase n=1 Tax=Nannocystis radixulma TaxID=2995305 RepID=A0ABT5BB04_9BACT|nr:serine/threonine-protein kinase [Nannocystis radixulma]MDC0670825.1 serine/threonine-protein kinase [Nannocystis radixulma]
MVESSHTDTIAPPAPGCLSEDEIVDYCNDEADESARRRVEVHIDRCGECRALIAEFVRGWQGRATALQDALDHTDSQGAAPEPVAPGQVGRYVLLERKGAGGMGVVYMAYDPQLGRRVALKLLAPFMAADPLAQARMLREAQAMALLAHPNVAAIHDAGIHLDRVWLAMEFIDGETLVAWLAARPRGWREVLAMFVAAGEGLAAAHAAGLVHRDFKPDNVLVGREGRPRVVDFGLARGNDDAARMDAGEVDDDALRRPLTRPGATPGTPRYMAPEQWLGQAVDPRTDAFAFCVALWEALYGEHPFPTTSAAALAEAVIGEQVRTPLNAGRVPGFVRQALRRGLASDPERRFPTMAALLTALRNDPRRRNLRRALIVAVIVVIAIVSGWYSLARAGAIAACTAQAGEIGAVWHPGRREALERQIEASGDPLAAASFTATARRIDEYAAAWAGLRREACVLATVEETLAPEVYAHLENCLDERLLGLGVTLEILGDRATIGRLGGAIMGMRSPGSCRDPVQLLRHPPLPANERAESAAIRQAVMRVPLLLGAQQHEAAAAAATAAQAQAAALDRPQLRALAAMATADVALHRNDFAAAEASLLEAVHVAGASGGDEIAAEAARSLVDVAISHNGDVAGARLWARQVEMWWARQARAPDDVRQAAVHATNAKVYLAAGDEEAAITAMLRALAIYGRGFGEHDGDVAGILLDLANIHTRRGSHAAALAEYQRALAIHTRVHGPHSTYAADTLYNLGSLAETLESYESARASFRQALSAYETAYGRDHVDVGDTWARLGRVELSRRDLAAAERCFARALAIAEVDRAERSTLRVVALAGLGEVFLNLRERGATSEALAMLAAAEAELADAELAEIDRAHLQFALARALWAADSDKPRALESARAARQTFKNSPEANRGWRAATEHWLAARARQ